MLLSNVASLVTKQAWPYQTGRITVASFGAALSADNAATIEYGMFDSSDGYFLRVVGTSLFMVRRTSSGERPSDHLDGYTGQGANPNEFTVDAAVMAAQPNRTDEGTIYKIISSSPNVMEEIVPWQVIGTVIDSSELTALPLSELQTQRLCMN